MKWIITEDKVNNEHDRLIMGWRELGSVGINDGALRMKTQAEVDAYAVGLPMQFRLLDGDDEVYFVGLCENLDDQDSDSAFGPLDCYGESYGCVSMEYRLVGATEWEPL